MKKFQDKRFFARGALKQDLGFEVSILHSGRPRNSLEQGAGVDLSSGGIGITTRHPLERGEVVKMFLPVTVGETKIPVFTEVVWSTHRDGEYRAGLRFLR